MTKTSIACDAQLTKYRLQSVLVCTLNLPAYQSLNHLSSSSVIEGYCEIVSRDVNETYWRLCLPGTQDFHCSLAVFSTCNIRHKQCFRAEEGKKNKNRKAADWGELRNLDSDLVLKGLQMILNFLGNWPNFHRSHPSSNLSSPPSVQERSRHLLCELTFLQLSRKLKTIAVLMQFSQGESRQANRLLTIIKQNYSSTKEIYLAGDSSCSSLSKVHQTGNFPMNRGWFFWQDLQAVSWKLYNFL